MSQNFNLANYNGFNCFNKTRNSNKYYKSLYTATIGAVSFSNNSKDSNSNNSSSNNSSINNNNNNNNNNISNSNHYKVIILGSGPAGLTAALYTSRGNLSPLLIEGDEPGGQLTTTTEVENYPGFVDGIDGNKLVSDMREQCIKFGTICKSESIKSVNFKTHPFELNTRKNKYFADSVIISTGASAIYLGLKNELALIGYGVSACATCDGFFFKNKNVAVVGGGDSAMEEALFLTKFANKVTVIHRRDKLRASKIMQDRAFENNKIEFLWNSQISDVIGDKENGVNSLKIFNNKTNSEYILNNIQGLFLAIGHKPNTQIFKNELELDEKGYIIVNPGTVNTSVSGIFACGDVQDTKYKQAITAAGSGCMAAMDCEKYLEKLYHQNTINQFNQRQSKL